MNLFIAALIGATLPAFAGDLTGESLAGRYSLTGKNGFLNFELTLHAEGAADLTKLMLDGSTMVCHGQYTLRKSELEMIFDCPGKTRLGMRTSFDGISCDFLLDGAKQRVRFSSDHGAGSWATVTFRKR